MTEIQKAIVVVLVLIFLGLNCEGRHLNILTSGKGGYQPNNNGRLRAGIRDLVASPSFENRRQRKVMSKTFQNILDNKMRRKSIVNDNQNGASQPQQNSMGTNRNVNNNNQMQNNNYAPVYNQQINGKNIGSSLQQASNELPNSLNLLAQLLASRAVQNNQQLNVNPPNLGNININQQPQNNMNQMNSSPQNNRINIKVTRKTAVPFPSLINKRVNGYAANPARSNTISKTPVITMVPKRQFKSNIAKKILEKKRLTMVEKLRSIPKLSLSEIKAAASKTLQKAVSNQRQASAKGFMAKLDTTNKIKVIAKNDTAELKIINSKPTETVSDGIHKPNFIVLKDITITNTSTETANGTVNGTKMSITLMSQATGGRPIVIEANSNIVLSQEKMANGTVQFIIRTDTKSTTPATTTVPSTTMPTEEPEIEAEETTTTPMPTTTGEV